MLRKELVQKILDNNTRLLANLYGRWLDEGKYEDINEYLKVIQKSIPEAYKINKKPFMIICKTDDVDGDLFFKVTVRGFEWGCVPRIASEQHYAKLEVKTSTGWKVKYFSFSTPWKFGKFLKSYYAGKEYSWDEISAAEAEMLKKAYKKEFKVID